MSTKKKDGTNVKKIKKPRYSKETEDFWGDPEYVEFVCWILGIYLTVFILGLCS